MSNGGLPVEGEIAIAIVVILHVRAHAHTSPGVILHVLNLDQCWELRLTGLLVTQVIGIRCAMQLVGIRIIQGLRSEKRVGMIVPHPIVHTQSSAVWSITIKRVDLSCHHLLEA